VVARYDDEEGTPAIVEVKGEGTQVAAGEEASTPASTSTSRGERGRVVLFNLSADRDWNDWPTDPSYPIVLQEWVRYLAPRAGARASLRAGDAISWPAAPGLRFTLYTPDGRAGVIDERQGARAVFPRAEAAGFYCVLPSLTESRAEVDPESLEPLWFAVNRDPRESDLRPAAELQLRSALADEGVELVMGGFGAGAGAGAEAGAGTDLGAEEGGEIWRWCALGAGIFLLLELFVACWFGRR
jgi:hypothetical protein